MFYTEYNAPIGRITIASDGTNIVGLWFAGQRYAPQDPGVRADDLAVLRHAQVWLGRYFAGENLSPRELPLAPVGSAFRRAVWQCLLEIPYGKVTTYGALAKQVAVRLGVAQMSAQAVGGAVGHNSISVMIPCHRVVGADGSLVGYAAGVEIKRALLALEGIDIS